jgi:hypothetical protein
VLISDRNLTVPHNELAN